MERTSTYQQRPLKSMASLSLFLLIIFFGIASAGGYGSFGGYGGASASSSASASASSFSTGNSGGISGNPFLSKAAKVDNNDDKNGQLLFIHPQVNLNGVKDGLNGIQEGVVGIIDGVLDGIHTIHGPPVRPNIFLGPRPFGSNSGDVGIGYGSSFAGASAGANAFAGGFGAGNPGKKNCAGPGCYSGRGNKPVHQPPAQKPSCNGFPCRENNNNNMNPLELGTSNQPVYPSRPVNPTYPNTPIFSSTPQQPCHGPACRGGKNNGNPSGHQPSCNGPSCRGHSNNNPPEPGTNYLPPTYSPKHKTPNDEPWQPVINPQGSSQGGPVNWHPVINPSPACIGPSCDGKKNPGAGCSGPSCTQDGHERPIFLTPNYNSKQSPSSGCSGYNCQGKNIPSGGNPYSSTGCPGPYCDGPEYSKPKCSGPTCARRNQPKPVCTGPNCEGNQFSTTGCPGPYCDGPEYSKPKCSGPNCGAKQNPSVGCVGANCGGSDYERPSCPGPNCQGSGSPPSSSSYPICPGPDCNGVIHAIPQKPTPHRPAGCTSGNCQPRESHSSPVWPSFQKPNFGHNKEIQLSGGNSGCTTGACPDNKGDGHGYIGGGSFSSSSASSSSSANAGTGANHGLFGPGSGTGLYGGSFSNSFASASASSSSSAHSGGYGR